MPDILDLIHRFRQGDERAAEIIYNRYRSSIFKMACLILNSEADAEEVAQDTFVDAFRAINHYDAGQAQFITWLRKIMLNRCRKTLRAQRRKSIIPFLSWIEFHRSTPEPSPGPEERVFGRMEGEAVWNAIQTLSRPLREAILLRYHGECTFSEIAYIQKCNLRTAQSRVRVGLAQLKNKLSENSASQWLEREY